LAILELGAMPAEMVILVVSNTSLRICSTRVSGAMSGWSSRYYISPSVVVLSNKSCSGQHLCQIEERLVYTGTMESRIIFDEYGSDFFCLCTVFTN
jgi:hypothetical protein